MIPSLVLNFWHTGLLGFGLPITPALGSAALIAGLLTISIPIIIHLMHRQKTTPILWGAMIFLRQTPLQMKRRRNIDYWILLLLRMLAIGLLGFMLASPQLNKPSEHSSRGTQSVDLAVVVDHSMSMGRRRGDRTLFDNARDVVDRLVNPANPVLRGGDTISVILAEHRPRKLTPLPVQMRNGPDIARLDAALHSVAPGMTDCNIPEAIEAAREVVTRGLNSRKVVLVVSDEQKNNWSIADFAAWQRAVGDESASIDHRVEVHSYPLLADEMSSNISIGDVAVQPTLVGVGRPVQFTAAVSNSGPKDVTAINVHLSVNGTEVGAAQTIPSLGAKQSVTVRFDYTFDKPGSAYVKIWTDVVDALAADNESVAAIHVWDKLPILIIDGQLTTAQSFRNSLFLAAAMQPVDADKMSTALVQPKVISVSDSAREKLEDYYAVVINDVPQLPQALLSRLPSYVSTGHGLWVILGGRTNAGFIESLKQSDEAVGLFAADLKSATPHKEKDPVGFEVKDPGNPMVALVSAERNALAGAVAESWWSLTPRDADTSVAVASTTGDPLVMERPLGNGRIVVWSSSVEGEWNNLPAMPNFVPIVNETLYHLTAAQTREHTSANVSAGQSLSWLGPANPSVAKVDVKLPDNTVDAGRKANFRDGHWEFTYPNAFMPGVYSLNFTPAEVPQPIYYGVSIDRRELDGTRLADADIEWLKKGQFFPADAPRVEAEQLEYILTGANEPSGFWWKLAKFLLRWETLAVLVVASLFGETFMTWKMAGRQKSVDVENAGLVVKAPITT